MFILRSPASSSSLVLLVSDTALVSKRHTDRNTRLTCACISIPKCGNLWKDHPPRLAGKIHIPSRVKSKGLEQGKASIWLMCSTDTIPWNDNSGLLCYYRRSSNEPSR